MNVKPGQRAVIVAALDKSFTSNIGRIVEVEFAHVHPFHSAPAWVVKSLSAPLLARRPNGDFHLAAAAIVLDRNLRPLVDPKDIIGAEFTEIPKRIHEVV